jgi:hypothetical protein
MKQTRSESGICLLSKLQRNSVAMEAKMKSECDLTGEMEQMKMKMNAVKCIIKANA